MQLSMMIAPSFFSLITTFFSYLAFSLTTGLSFGQADDGAYYQRVLLNEKINEEVVFGKWNVNGKPEMHLCYLGKVRTKQGRTYKIINSVVYWGLSKRATSRILIFDSQNKYQGNYYVALTNDLPTSLNDGKLIFKNKEDECDSKLVTSVDLTMGLPKRFFKECTKGQGDVYQFERG